MTELLDAAAIDRQVEGLASWQLDGDTIRAVYNRETFPDAVAFVVRVAFLAEAANHHPDIAINWCDVTLALCTHDAGGLTQLDFELAAQIDKVS